MEELCHWRKDSTTKKEEMDIWMIFRNIGPSYKALLEERKPDIEKTIVKLELDEEKISRNVEHNWRWKEEKRRGKVERRGRPYSWVGEGDPPDDDQFDWTKNNWEITEEDEKTLKEQEEKWLRQELEAMREEKKRYMKEYHKKKKEALQQPIVMGEKSDVSENER